MVKNIKGISIKTKIPITIKIYTRKFPAILLLCRTDGMGCRLSSLLTAMYLSEKLGWKFGFLWDKFFYKYGNDEFMEVPEVDKVFNKDFIDKHCYNGAIQLRHDPTFNPINIDIAPEVKDYQEIWGNYFNHHTSDSKFLKDESFKTYIQKAWKNLPFVDDLKNIIKDIEHLKIKNFIAIHIRNGDVFGKIALNLGNHPIVYRMFPLEIALDIIKNNKNAKIILFSPDGEIISKFAFMLRQKGFEIYTAKDLISDYKQQFYNDFAELIFLSYAKRIYRSDASLYSDLAYYIGNAHSKISIGEIYSPVKQYEIIINNPVKDIYNNSICKIAINIYLYLKYYNAQKNIFKYIKDFLKYLKISEELEIFFFHRVILFHLLNSKRYSTANLFFKKYCDNVLDMIFFKGVYISHAYILDDLKKEILNLIRNSNIYYPFLYKAAYEISLRDKNYEVAIDLLKKINKMGIIESKEKIKKHLSYRLGKIFIDNYNFLSFYKIPFLFYKEYKKYKKEKGI
ncbi:hypothetical protein H2266_07215 [Campylobacter sp. RM10543]|uniref:hypothetical protein n=1 Tax=Campylobacter molothri TaxID=1032242 RepID=UPI00301D6E02|nr:hypothetical protein [Campylobacter sp. RM10543]